MSVAGLARRACVQVLLIGLLGSAGCETSRHPGQKVAPTAQRVVSLSPGITESIIALGASAQLVGISDYCTPPANLHAPRVGSAITPNYEAITRQRPDLILATQVAGTQLDPLARLAETHALPWLSLDEVQSSLSELGRLLGRDQAATALVRRLDTSLRVAPSKTGPRVLWVLDWGDDAATTTWFIRDNSLHGAVLRAAGAQNAVPQPVSQPTLSAEQLLQVNPEVIVQVLSAPHLSNSEIAQAQARLHRHFARYAPLRAVATGRLLAVHHPGAMNLGPGVLDLIDTLRHALASTASVVAPASTSSSLSPP